MKKFDITNTQREILEKIINHPGLSRADLAKEFKLNKSTTSYITKELEEKNYIEFYRGVNNEGRKGSYIRFCGDDIILLFIEIAKTKAKFYVCKPNAEVIEMIESEIISDNHLEIFDKYIKFITNKYKVIKECVFATHGTVNRKTLEINSPFFEMKIKDISNICKENGVDFAVENESNIYAMGKISTEVNDVINIKMRDGVGAGIVLNKKLHTGSDGIAGEVGHTIIEPNGRNCRCGQQGCIETYISDTNVYLDCQKILGVNVDKYNFLEYYKNNSEIKKLMDERIDYLCLLVNNLCVTYNPDRIYITSNLYAQIETLEQTIRNNCRFIESDIRVRCFEQKQFIKGFCRFYLHQKI